MAIDRPTIEQYLASMGAAGHRICEIDASEAGAGNISICLDELPRVRQLFPISARIELPLAAPALAGRTLLVTGSGRRLRQIAENPLAAIAAVVVDADGVGAEMLSSPQRQFDALTSEFNSHLAVHDDQVGRRGLDFHAVVHAQPPHLTYLSHVPTYRDTETMNRRILRWEPESIVALRDGIGVLEFMVPGSAELMAANVQGLREHEIVLWSKHGVMARSDLSVTRAVDRVEYAETGAKYEYMNLTAGGHGEGLSTDEIRAVADAFGVTSRWVS
ncbi:class II aldolase/adducin family protein [Microbacterium jiangjiandongii]|uniref:class II aldolase/adducin family protein n=1 Tax=Microbacterium jiangjiandongii TaxID=3049071 RepID=UPI00214B7912|nr:class II aldolase/adducin family protein [Microbacterium sp. zg.Y843]MCR2816905.1 class II aldolase/adducin family protein [Microbacterium sp. zg.Y843]